MKLNKIIKDKEFQIKETCKQICKDTEQKILKLLVDEFSKEFTDIIVNCPKDYGYDEVIIKDKDRWIKLYLSSYEFKNGSHVKIGYKGSGDFTNKEIKSIKERIDKLF